jgi:hypothetical protein
MGDLAKRGTSELGKQDKSADKKSINARHNQTITILAQAVREKSNSARQTLEKVAEVACGVDAVKEALSKESRWVVDMSETAKNAIKEGLIKLDTNKAGETYAQIRDSKGHYSTKFPIKEELVAKGLNPLEVQSAIKTQAIQEQLEEIVTTLQDINEGVSEVIQGQHNDRIGLLAGGQALYLESCEISDPTMRHLLEAQSLKSLSDANGQLAQGVTTDIKYLTEGKYKTKKKSESQAIEDRLSSIRSELDALNMTVALKAAIYYKNNETSAMVKCLEQYAGFINDAVSVNSKKLAELDSTDQLPAGGFWEEKAKALNAVGEISHLLEAPEVEVLPVLPEGSEEIDNYER